MEIILFAVAIGLFAFLLLMGIIYLLFGRPRSLEERVRQPAAGKTGRGLKWRDLLRGSERVLKPLGEIIPRSPDEMSRQERRLVQAGIRRKDGPVLFLGTQVGVALLLFIVSAVTGYLEENPFLFIILPIFLGAAIPDLLLARRIRNRKERIQLSLPDLLDLTVVCVEAGLGLDQSLMRIGQEIRSNHPDLSDELRLFNLEVNAGRSRTQALRNLSERTEVDDFKALVAVLIQTDRFGTSIAQSLRVFSDSLRTKRRQRAEERAAKLTVKMIPPLVFFIMPAMFVVVLGPAVIGVVRDLLPMLRGEK